ncbi:zinc finger protein 600-like [Macrobrachium rosenbergii]|uniref:zinc finger protein 600-like n=1 Tax=Macrobrachium rosenbergii TaxID=79674 RepID=UPI0034D496F0
MEVKHTITASASRPIKVEDEDFTTDPEVLQNITSHEVPEIISQTGVRSTHNIETGIPCPAQVTIEVEEKSLYDPGGTYQEFSGNSSFGSSTSFKSVTVHSGKRRGDQARTQILKKTGAISKHENIEATSPIKDEPDNYSCFFCKAHFLSGLKVMHVVLGKQLPSSMLDPLSLLHCFGVQFPVSQTVDPTGFSTVDICSKCYVVITDCDILYPHLHSAVTKILEVWPEKMNGMKTLSLNVSFDGNRTVPVNCKSSPLKEKKKLLLPDVQLSFSYTRASDLPSKSPQRSGDSDISHSGNVACESRNSKKVCVSEIFTCGFCGKVFNSEEDWSNHASTEHKILQKWLSYDLQVSLKRTVGNEVHRNNICNTRQDKGTGECRCYACNSTYQNKNELLKHLQEYHKMVVEKTEKLPAPNKGEMLPEVTCKTEPDYADDQMSTCYSDGRGSTGDLDDLENELQTSDGKSKQRNGAKPHVQFVRVKGKGGETAVKKVYAPHWRCRICGMLFSSHEVLMRHRSQSHPETTRIIKKKDYGDNFVNTIGESRVKMEVRCPVCNQFVESNESLKDHLQIIHQKYMVVLDDKTPPTVESGSKKEKIRASRRGRGAKSRGQPPKEDLGYCVVLKGDGQGGINDQRLKIDEELQVFEGNGDSQEQNTNSDIEAMEEKEKKVICGICGEEFENRILMAEHSCSVKEDIEAVENTDVTGGPNEIVMLECKLCDRRLHGVNALRIHMARVHGDPNKRRQYKHRCKVCSFQTRLRSQFYKHMKESHSIDVQPPVKCFVCGKMYNSQYISRHIAVVHGTTNNKKYSCKFCDMKYHDLVYLKRHVYFDHANTKWKCQVCDMEFEKYHQLRQHRVNVHGTKIHKCADCEKTFKRKGDLTTHRKRRHEAKVPSVCSFCSKAYSEPSKLRVHLIEKHEVPWENTLSRRYARHQQENNCLKRHNAKDTRVTSEVVNTEGYIQHKQIRNIQSESGIHKSDSSYEEEEFEEDFHGQQKFSEVNSGQHLPQGEIVSSKGSVLSSYENSQVNDVPGSEYDVVEVTETDENMGNIGEISYIIYEESSS